MPIIYRRVCALLVLLVLYSGFGWSGNLAAQPTVSVQADWGSLFHDPMLDSLLKQALANNKNVLQALNRIDAAKASERIARGNFFPQIGVNASWERNRESGAFSPSGEPTYQNAGLLEATTSWEIDVFGSIRKQVKSSRELYKVSVENYRWVMVSLCAELTSAYINLRTYQQQYAVTAKNIASQEKVLEIAQARYKAGLVSRLDVLQAGTVYRNSRAQLPLLESKILQTQNTLSLLMGAAPENYLPDFPVDPAIFFDATVSGMLLDAPLATAPQWPVGEIPQVSLPDTLQIGLDRLLERPDIKAQEYTVNSYAAQVGASKADWLPKFFLKGAVGFSTENFNHLFRNRNLVFTVNPTVSWTLFSGRQLQEQTKLARANWDEAVNGFNQAVLTAMQEVENALSLYHAYSTQVEEYARLCAEGAEVLSLSLDLYKKGLQDFQTVLDAQRSLLGYENAWVTARGAKAAAFVQLVKAIPSFLETAS